MLQGQSLAFSCEKSHHVPMSCNKKLYRSTKLNILIKPLNYIVNRTHQINQPQRFKQYLVILGGYLDEFQGMCRF